MASSRPRSPFVIRIRPISGSGPTQSTCGRTKVDSSAPPCARLGDTLRIVVKNDLPEEPGHQNEHQNRHHGWNTTNLHTHGLHVSPAGNSDNVFLAIGPKQQFEYEIHIPEDHPAGTFWYHPHKHGSVAAQVSSGMAGALIVEGGLDRVDRLRDITEHVFVFQQVPYKRNGETPGEIELDAVDDLFGPGDWDTLKHFTTVNGVILPVLQMHPGEVQRWRFVDSGFREKLLLRLEPTGGGDVLAFHEIAVDGIPLGKVKRRETLELWPGYRSDVLVKAPDTPGEYLLVDERSPAGSSLLSTAEPRKYVGRLVLAGEPVQMSLPTDDDLKRFRPPSIDESLLTTRTNQRVVYSIIPEPLQYLVNGQPFDASRTRRLKLGAVEQWIALSSNPDVDVPVTHPFHIHTNPFEIVSIINSDGEQVLDEPVWRDTIALPEGWRITFRMRYERYIGSFVHHCHILDHEDQGMMEHVEISP